MPRISAPTVAQHRAERRRALLAAARTLLAEDPGRVPTLAAVASRAGLPRSSVYEYFRSRDDLLLELVREVLPNWSRRVTEAMAETESPSEQVLAYVATNLRLVAEGEHALATALIALVPGEETNTSARQMHEQMTTPLVAALSELRLPDPASTAALINSVVYTASRMIEAGTDETSTHERVRELLDPFLSQRPPSTRSAGRRGTRRAPR